MRVIVVIVFLALLSLAAANKNRAVHKHRLDSNDPASFVRMNVPSSADVVFAKCVDVPVIGNACASLYVFPNNLTVGAAVTVGTYVLFNQELSAGSICADDQQLLGLLDKIPVLLPFKPLIMALIALHHFIPAEVFSICLDTRNLTVTREEISGCSQLDVVLICWQNDCAWRGNVSLGCFDVPLLELEQQAAAEHKDAKPVHAKNARTRQARHHGMRSVEGQQPHARAGRPMRQHETKKPGQHQLEHAPVRQHATKKPVQHKPEHAPVRQHEMKKPIEHKPEHAPVRQHETKKPIEHFPSLAEHAHTPADKAGPARPARRTRA